MGRVEANFQDTEIGLMPEDWKITSFADIADKKIIRSIAGGPFGSNLKNSDYTSDGVRIIQLQNIGDGNFIDDYKIYTSEKKAKELINYHIFPKEIILSKMGDPVARACIIPDIEEKYIMSSDGIRLVVDEEDFDKKFIFFYINSEYFRKRAFAVSMGSTRLRIGLPQLKKLKILKPSTKDEQTAIANALSDADLYIESLEKLIAKKQKIKQGAMQQLLKPKPHWEFKKLGEIADIVRGASPRPIEDPKWFDNNSSIGWVRISDVTSSVKNLKFTTQKLSDLGVRNSRYVEKENLIMSICATIGRPIITKIDVCIHDGFVVFRKLDISKDYLYYFLSFIEKHWSKNGQTGSQMNLNTNLIKSTEIYFPKTEIEQKEIAQTFSDMDSEIEVLTKKINKTKAIKQGMMQQLLTGKIRLV